MIGTRKKAKREGRPKKSADAIPSDVHSPYTGLKNDLCPQCKFFGGGSICRRYPPTQIEGKAVYPILPDLKGCGEYQGA